MGAVVVEFVCDVGEAEEAGFPVVGVDMG